MVSKANKPDPMQIVAHNLRRLRLEAGLSQVELAERAGLDRTFVSLCERCHRNVTVHSLFALAEGLGEDAAALVVTPHHDITLLPEDARANVRARVGHAPDRAAARVRAGGSKKRMRSP